MGYLTALGEQFKRKNALEQAQAQYDAQQARAQRSYNTLDQIAPIIPQNPAEQAALERQGFIPYTGYMDIQTPEGVMNVPAENAYISPERQLMQDERIYQDQVAQQRFDDYQNKLQSPLFNIGDTVTDIANNTIGLPLKLLGGGQNPFGDPSARAKASYEQDLEDISKLHAFNQQHFLNKRDAREAAFAQSLGGIGDPASVREYNFFDSLSPNDQARYLNVKRSGTTMNLGNEMVRLGGDGQVQNTFDVNLTPSQELEYLTDAAGAQVQGSQSETRLQNVINSGLRAAETIPTIIRSIDLLKGIKTGGLSRAQLFASQVFGIESADEGELSNLLGKAVISQYREVFGAQFTEEEGKKLDRIEAGLGKSTEANLRVLNNVLTLAKAKADLARRLATKRQDKDTLDLIDIYSQIDLGDQNPPSTDDLLKKYGQ